MAHQNFDGPYSLPAAADLRTNQYQFIVINGSGLIALCGAGARPRGILDNLPNTNEMARFFSHHGVAMKIKAGAAIAAYAKIMSDATGRAITGTSTNYGCGVALEAASAAGDIITIFYDPEGILP